MKPTKKFLNTPLKSGHAGGKNTSKRQTKQRPMSRALMAIATIALLTTATPAMAKDTNLETAATNPIAIQASQPTQNFEQLFNKAIAKSDAIATAEETTSKGKDDKKGKPWYFWLLMAGIASLPYGHYKMGMAMLANDKRKEEEKKKKEAEEARKKKLADNMKGLQNGKSKSKSKSNDTPPKNDTPKPPKQ